MMEAAATRSVDDRPFYSRNSFSGIMAAILPVTVTGTPITVQPGMVQGMVDYLHMSDVDAGFTASAEVSGLMLATILFAFLCGRLNWKIAYAAGLFVVIGANIATLGLAASPAFTTIRAVAGIGAGLVTAIGFASLGETDNAPRNYGWAVASIIGYSAVALWLLPAIFRIGGYNALLGGYALATALCLPCIFALPHSRAVTGELGDRMGGERIRSRYDGMLGVMAVLIFFVGYAAAWTYMALIGRDAHLGEEAVAHVLSISQFFGVAGALSIVWLSGRISDRLQAVTILFTGALGIIAFTAGQGYMIYLTLNCLFQFAWNAGQPLLLGIVAKSDRTGKLLHFAIPMQYIGLAAGPALAALLLGIHKDYAQVMLGAGIVAAASLAAILPLTLRKPARWVDLRHIPTETAL